MYKRVISIGLPMSATMAANMVMQFTDRLFLSRYDLNAVAAVNPSGMAFMVCLMFLMGVVNYGGILIAHYVGAGDDTRVGSAVWQSIYCALGSSVVMGLLWLAAPAIFGLIGHPPEVTCGEIVYFRILSLFVGLPLVAGALLGYFTGRGATRPVMVVQFAASLVNIPLDYLMINGYWGFPQMGIAGAAYATATAWGVSLVLLAILAFGGRERARFGLLTRRGIDVGILRRLVRFGLPNGVDQCIEIAGLAFFFFMLGRVGALELGASNMVFALDSLIFTPTVGFKIAVGTLVGQAMGGGRIDEAATAANQTLHLALAYMWTVSLIFFIIPGPLLGIFRPGNLSASEWMELRRIGVVLVRLVALYCLWSALAIVYFGALKGAGDTVFVMLINITGALLIIVPMTLMDHWGELSLLRLWLNFTLANGFLSAAAFLRFRSGRWKRIRLTGPSSASHPSPQNEPARCPRGCE